MSAATMTRGGYATQLAAHGFRLFPCIPNGKTPAAKRWPRVATNDADTVRGWFADNAHNIGVYAGERIVGGVVRHMVVIDLDTKGGKDGAAELRALAKPYGGLPDTLTIRTPSGGSHLYFYASRAVGSNANVLAPGVDVRGQGGFVVGPGSEVEGGAYTVAADHDLADCPAWLEALLPHPGAKPGERGKRAALPGIDPERATARAVEYLTGLDTITEGGRNHAAFAAAARVKDLGCDADECLGLMLEHWPCEPMLDSGELQQTIASAYRNGQNPQGVDAPEAQFEPVEPDDNEPQVLHPFDELNKEWAAVAEPPNTVVYRFRKDSATGQTCFDRYTREGFMGLLANQKFEGKPLASEWWASPRRRTYHAGTDFAPGRVLPPDCLNTWGGFAVQPAPGDWSLMRAHVRDVICSGDAALDAYVMGWLARMVQHPGEPGQVALVLRGGRGTGKGTLGEMLARVFGVHGLHIGNSERLTGNFNGHLVGKVFLFADEAFYAGRRADEATLKMLVTERALDVEAKYQAARNVRNCLHILMASNESWVVPAGPLERRFCVIDVSESRQQDNGYFGRIRDQMDRGGLGAMLHDLLAHDLAGFDVWKVPHTRAGTEQRADSLRGPERWLFDALARGRVMCHDWTDEGLQLPKDEAFSDYRMRHRELGDHTPVHAVGFWKRVSAVLAAGGIQAKDTRPRIGSDRVLTRVLPSLTETRAAFDAWLGGVPTEWDPA